MLLRRVFSTGCCAVSLILAAANFVPVPVFASAGFQPPNPDELKMTSEPLAPGAPAIILYRQVDRDDNAQTPHEDDYIRIKILTEEGRKYANVEIPFFRESEDIVKVRARTVHPDGSIINFEGKVYEKIIEKGRSSHYLAKTFTLQDVEVGSIIEYYFTYDLREHLCLRFALDSKFRPVHKERRVLAEALHGLLFNDAAPLDLARPTDRLGSEARPGQNRPDGSPQYSRIPNGRLHASCK